MLTVWQCYSQYPLSWISILRWAQFMAEIFRDSTAGLNSFPQLRQRRAQ
jgi:hypothetical protein